MIVEFLIACAFGFFSGLMAGVIAVIAILLLGKRGISITSLRSELEAQIASQISRQSWLDTTNVNQSPTPPQNPKTTGSKSATTDSPQQRAARFQVVKDRDGNASSQENGLKGREWPGGSP